MKILTIFLFTLSSYISVAQQGDTLYKGSFWQSSLDTEICYRVITKHDSIWLREDFYKKNNQLKLSVPFKDSFYSVKTGFLTRHLPDGTLADSVRYENNVAKEAWFFHDNGNKSAYELYENNKLITSTYWDENGLVIDKQYKEPGYKSEYASYKDYLEVSYDRDQPKDYKKGKIFGKVFIEYFVGKEGYVTDAKVKMSSGYPELDTHALNIIKNSPRFPPFRVHGRKVIVKRVQHFTYPSLNELY